MRTIAIDVREALSDQPTGKGRWARCFLEELLGRSIPLFLLSHRPIVGALRSASASSVIFPPGPLWHLRAARHLLGMRERVLSFSPTSYIVPFLIGGTVPTVLLVHDLIAFRDEPHQRKARWIERLTLKRALSLSRHVCVTSEATKHDLLNRWNALPENRITVISAGPFSAHPAPSTPDGTTILHVGTLCPRKNQLRLIEAYRLLPEEIRTHTRLVLAGVRGWQDREILRLARETPGVDWRGYVSDAEYEHLLETATVFAFPSLYEGFGMPVLDALQRGVPVLTSRRGSLPEAAGEAAAFVDPEDVPSIARGLQTLLTDEALRARLRAEGPAQAAQFSWKRTADRFLEAVQPLL